MHLYGAAQPPTPMKPGTSSVVVAAFVGPGTVLTCASAGVSFGYALGWVLLFSTVSVFVLQSFTAGTGILAGRGLGEALRLHVTSPVGRAAAFGLVVLGLWVGCAAFELGNLVGAAAGVATLAGLEGDARWIVVALGLAAAGLLLLEVRVLVRLFTALVVGMSGLFVAALVVAPTDWPAALAGLFIPALPEGSLVTAVALVGTTVVTYNLFLHPSVAKRYWADEPDRRRAWRGELAGMAVFLPLGGLISFAILATGAVLGRSGAAVEGVGGLAGVLEPVAGPAARVLFGLGLFAAGITSAMTAPLAAAVGIGEIFGWAGGTRALRFRLVWASVVLTGVVFGLTGWSPLRVIVAAQAANGVLLPLVAGFMLMLTLRQREVQVPLWYRALGILVTLVCAGLGARTLVWVGRQVFG